MKRFCNCFKCDTPLQDIGEPEKYIQPLDGMEFISYGAYGTTFFDPCDGSHISIVVCDECLKTHFGVPYM